jgi:hypothetical protein
LAAISQPSSPFPSSGAQSRKPALHVGVHRLAAHVVAVVFAALQARLQAPQCAEVIAGSVSQPSSAAVPSSISQSANVPVQVGLHKPVSQAEALAFATLQS